MQEDLAAEVDEAFSRAFGEHLRQARVKKGWSQRRLAEALDSRGLKLDPSAVTRIERGSRDVKLREAAVVAECLEVDLQELMRPTGADPLAIVLELLKNAENRFHAGRSAFAEMALNVRSVDAYLQMRPELVEELGRLRGVDDTLDAHELLVEELRAMTSDNRPIQVSDADERLLALLQQTVNAAVEDLFSQDDSPGSADEECSTLASDAEA